jgi:phage-related minor tail protein
MRIEDAAGQSLSVETEAMKEARTDPSEVAAAVTPLPLAVVKA